jgi:hypothetical protein
MFLSFVASVAGLVVSRLLFPSSVFAALVSLSFSRFVEPFCGSQPMLPTGFYSKTLA